MAKHKVAPFFRTRCSRNNYNRLATVHHEIVDCSLFSREMDQYYYESLLYKVLSAMCACLANDLMIKRNSILKVTKFDFWCSKK